MPLISTNSKQAKLAETSTARHIRVSQTFPETSLPFKTRLSFVPLLRDWEKRHESDDPAERQYAREILTKVEAIPGFWEPIDDLSFLQEQEEVVSLLLAGLLPLSLRGKQLGRVAKPYDLNSFFDTPAVRDLISGCNLNVTIEFSGEVSMDTIYLRACAQILNQCYGQHLSIEPAVIYSIRKNECGYTEHFKSDLTIDFSEVVPIKPLKPLTQKEVNRLLANMYHTDAWLKALPPDAFEIHGLMGITLVNITKEESVSRLRKHLLQKEALTNDDNVLRVEELLRSYFRIPDLKLGIMAIDYPMRRERENFRYIRHCLLENWESLQLWDEQNPSAYVKAARYAHTVLLEQLKEIKDSTELEKALLEQGFQSYLAAPLKDKDDNIIGLLELGAKKPYSINSLVEIQLNDLLQLFNTAVERRREETDNRAEAIMRSHFTAIHSSVEWRFEEEAFRYMHALDAGSTTPRMGRITFDNLYPLYAQADIVNSSITRNQAIQEDLILNLKLLSNVLKTALTEAAFPLLEHYLLQTEHWIEALKKALQSSDESSMLNLIREEIHPFLEEIVQSNPVLLDTWNKYLAALDPQLGVVYKRRKDFEESVVRINLSLSSLLDKAEKRAQKMAPHYFEMFKTDGLQFEIYVGNSLLRSGLLSDFQLRNLRLWQLVTLCEITIEMERLRSTLPIPLQTAQLIFVYGQPISIYFRPDEKRFDIEGAYNLRYEIIKKRIDKAEVTLADGNTERLTQPGKIAIVYATDSDRTEYMGYFEFLRRKNLINGETENLPLKQLQGVQGLRALRIQVKSAAHPDPSSTT